ncbi:hypothetical protein JMN32_00115 [Fulvivirga sp. 29W222]|uniref:Uncharacterized protein n=1 Tax=Fulvivirga marina TaxID=2494733 RepID=A0A937KA59_9BACT|nr:hypothetical protein [Fulvivirga marina]MBL6444691.1 hypothetical protein [Fulvivirga marina]
MSGGYQSDVIISGGTKVLFRDHVSHGVPPGSGNSEVELSQPYTLSLASLQINEGIRIYTSGSFSRFNNKTLRLYIGDEEVISNTNAPAAAGDFVMEAFLYKSSLFQAKGWATLLINNREGDVRAINPILQDPDNPGGPEDKVIRITGQSSVEQPGSITLSNFIIEQI